MRWMVCVVGLCLLLPGARALATPPGGTGLLPALMAALKNHPAVKGVQSELAGQGFNIDTARAERYPNLSGQFSKQDDGSDYGTLQLRQPLWAFGKIDIPIAQAKEQYRVKELGLLQVQRQLLEETAAAYAAVLGTRRQLAVADENIAEHQTLYQRIERRRAGKLASDADVQLALSRLSQAESQREKLSGALRVALAELRALTQIEINADTPVDPNLLTLPDPAGVKSLARKNNADILLKQQLIEVAKNTVRLEKVASTPTLYAEAERDYLDSTNANETRLGIVIEGRLGGAGLGIFSRVKSASARVEAARQDLGSTRNDVELRIDNLLTNLSLQSRLQQAQRHSVSAVRETRASFMRQYDTGRKTWIEVLNIQRELTEQRLQLVQADNGWLSLSLRIAVSIGQLDAAVGIAATGQATAKQTGW